jgi:hypothetical protein
LAEAAFFREQTVVSEGLQSGDLDRRQHWAAPSSEGGSDYPIAQARGSSSSRFPMVFHLRSPVARDSLYTGTIGTAQVQAGCFQASFGARQ